MIDQRFPPNETPMTPVEKRKLKRIENHTDDELDTAVNTAVLHCKTAGLDFFKLLHGVDAYMHRRKRRDDQRHQREMDENLNDVCDEDMWGD